MELAMILLESMNQGLAGLGAGVAAIGAGIGGNAGAATGHRL